MITMTKEQISALMCKHAEKENGLQDLMVVPQFVCLGPRSRGRGSEFQD